MWARTTAVGALAIVATSAASDGGVARTDRQWNCVGPKVAYMAVCAPPALVFCRHRNRVVLVSCDFMAMAGMGLGRRDGQSDVKGHKERQYGNDVA